MAINGANRKGSPRRDKGKISFYVASDVVSSFIYILLLLSFFDTVP